MKESYRLLKDDIKTGYDLIFIARNTINNRKANEVNKSITNALIKTKLMDRNKDHRS